jgi:hypothetical protein
MRVISLRHSDPGEVPRDELEAILRSALTRIGQLMGVCRLASAAVFAETRHSEVLASSCGSLDLAAAELGRLAAKIEAAQTDSRIIGRKLLSEAGAKLE